MQIYRHRDLSGREGRRDSTPCRVVRQTANDAAMEESTELQQILPVL